MTNVTITGNTSDNFGGGVHLWGGSKATMINSVIWDNSPQEIYLSEEGTDLGTDTISVYYSDIGGGSSDIETTSYSTVIWGDGNVDTDPLFVDADNGDYHLSDLSPVISAAASEVTIDGVTYTAPTTDIEENPRPNPSGTVSDMGAYENENGAGEYNGPVWYVDASSELPYANGSESAKFSKIQYGINAAAAGDTVLVAAGTYVENINFDGKNISIIGSGRETTIIDGDSSGTVVSFSNGEDSTAVLTGFTIKNGLEEFDGGGVQIYDSGPTLTNLLITDNTALGHGGGIYFRIGSDSTGLTPTLDNVLISSNTAEGDGGGSELGRAPSPRGG